MIALGISLLLLATPASGSSPSPHPEGEGAVADRAPAGPAQRILTLDEAIAAARANQPQLRQARANTSAAGARSDEARSALLPQVTGSASYQRSTGNFAAKPGSTPVTGAAQGGTSLQMFNYYSFGATASQLVWDFGQTPDRWRSAQASAEAQRDTEYYTGLQVLLGVRTAYFTARANKDLVGVASETLANQETHLRQVQGFVEVGTQPEIALAQSRTNVANARVQLINAENGYATARAQLNQAMGIEGPTDYDVANETLPPAEGEDQSTDDLLQRALRDRPDVASLDRQMRAQQLTLSSVRGGYFPSLGLSAGISNAGPALDNTVWNWNATATLTWNLFQGGLTNAQSQEAQASLDALTAQLDALRQQVRLDVEQARLAVRAAKTSLSAAGEALTNARQQLRLAEGRYQVGAGSIIELSDAQVTATSAAAQRVQADYNLATARAQLLRALGDRGPFAPQAGRP